MLGTWPTARDVRASRGHHPLDEGGSANIKFIQVFDLRGVSYTRMKRKAEHWPHESDGCFPSGHFQLKL